MSNLTYNSIVSRKGKDLIIVGSEIKTPPMSREARQFAGFQFRKLQEGERLSMPNALNW